MITRNILDPLGNIIGTLQFPDGTSETVISAALALYSTVPSNPLVQRVGTLCVSALGDVTTSSGTASTVTSMTLRPELGTYIALFNGNIYTSGASAKGEFGIYVDGVLLTETRRDISCALTLLGGLVTVSLNAIGVGTYTGTQIQLNGSQTVDVRFKSTNGGTIGFSERVFSLIQVQA